MGEVSQNALYKVKKNLTGIVKVEDLADRDLVVEAAAENLGLRKELFGALEAIGKTVVNCGDSTGFVVNRLLVLYMPDAIRVYEQGLASCDDIDNTMKLGCGYPMEPPLLTDSVGLDAACHTTEITFEEFKEPRFASPRS